MAYSFALQVAEFAKKAKGDTQEIVKKVAIDVASRVVMRSPVDTGRFRANWITTLDAPATDVVVDLDPSGSRAISAAVLAVNDAMLGQTVYIANNLPYARRLEDGYSQQAPQGMVELTAIEFQQFVDQAVRSLT